jgi:transcriptional regulator with GAF, ATPase, and Fis domain
MNQSDLVTSVGNTITQLDTLLMSGTPTFNSPPWQQLFALRKHLDDQQRALVQQAVQANDVAFQNAAATIQTATNNLNSAIKQQAGVDSIINIVSQISAGVDTVLKTV